MRTGSAGCGASNADELRAVEPHARGVAALDSPSTGIVDFAAVARSLAAGLRDRDADVVTGCAVESVRVEGDRVVLGHSQGETRAGFAVFCAGTAADRLAVAAGASPDPRIVPFKGSYLYLRPDRSHLVKSLIYPVPDPDLPFLGVHLSRHIDGRVSLGPERAPVAARRRRRRLARNAARRSALVAHRPRRAAPRATQGNVRGSGRPVRAGDPA